MAPSWADDDGISPMTRDQLAAAGWSPEKIDAAAARRLQRSKGSKPSADLGRAAHAKTAAEQAFVEAVRAAAARGMSYRDIARATGLSKSRIAQIVKSETSP